MEHNREVGSYAFVSKLLHWLIALVVLGMLSIGFFMSSLPDQLQPLVYLLHKSFGLTVLGLMVLRLAAITYYGRPRLPSSVALWEKIASRTIQYSFYALLVVIPLSGWMMSTASGRVPNYFGLLLLPFPGISLNKTLSHQADVVHCVLAWVLLVTVGLHIAGGLKHLLFNRDQVFQRMWF